MRRVLVFICLLIMLIPMTVGASSDWWDLTDTQRIELATNAIQEYSVPICYVQLFKDGDEEVVGYCGKNAVLRWYQFGENKNSDNLFYFKDDSWHCFNETALGFPTAIAVSAGEWNEARNNWDWVHFMCAIQVKEDVSKRDSWIVFQYDDVNIQPGDWQMPSPGELRIIQPELDGLKTTSYETIAKWELVEYPVLNWWLNRL